MFCLFCFFYPGGTKTPQKKSFACHSALWVFRRGGGRGGFQGGPARDFPKPIPFCGGGGGGGGPGPFRGGDPGGGWGGGGVPPPFRENFSFWLGNIRGEGGGGGGGPAINPPTRGGAPHGLFFFSGGGGELLFSNRGKKKPGGA